MNFLKTSNIVFVFSFLFLCLLLWTISFFILLPDYKKLQLDKNLKDVEVLISKIDTSIKNIKNITNDYSKWDDTYEFINKPNKAYIYENFREGTTTLEDLDIDFVIYSDKQGKILFSKYVKENFIEDFKDFEKTIKEKLKENEAYNSIEIYNSKPLYLIKSEVMKSDETGSSNGFMYTGRFITKNRLEKLSKIFKEIKIVDDEFENKNYTNFSFPHIFDIKLIHELEKTLINNHINFYNENNYIFTIDTPNKIDIIDRGEKTIILYNSILSLLLLIVFLIVYRNQKKLEDYSNQLENKVEERTSELNKTLRTIEKNNKKLYELSNIDSLTKIKNRRSFFEKSKKQLKKALMEDKEFCTVIIDIDFFKKINDSYGHAIGDEVLKEFCKIVNTCISENEIFGRLGGEEFCISFYDKEIHEVEKTAEKIRQKCQDTILEIKKQKVNFTISLGLSSKENSKHIDEILQVADELLYKAKKEGRNRLIRTSKY